MGENLEKNKTVNFNKSETEIIEEITDLDETISENNSAKVKKETKKNVSKKQRRTNRYNNINNKKNNKGKYYKKSIKRNNKLRSKKDTFNDNAKFKLKKSGFNKSRKPKIIFNITIYVLTIISLVLLILFCINIYKLNMLPVLFLRKVYLLLVSFFIFQFVFIIPPRLRVWVKIIPLTIVIIYGIVCFVGFRYIDDTIKFIDKVNDSLLEKENYYLISKEENKFTHIAKIKDKKVGFYNTFNKEKAIQYLEEQVKCNIIFYDDLLKMFEDLSNGEVYCLYVNNSLLNLLDTDLSYLKSDFVNCYIIEVPLKNVTEDVVKVVDVTNTKFNVYVAGGDSTGDINNVTNTDVNMIVSIDPINKKILLTSIPRDYYVKLSNISDNAYDKLTHAGYYGIETSIVAVEELLDIDINYYIKVNFSTVISVVDSIGGIDVYNDYSFRFKAYKYKEFNEQYIYFPKGWNHLNGRHALAFVRERKSFNDGDIQRVKNQQKVIEAIFNKVTSTPSLLLNYSELLQSISSSFSTNLNSEINRLVKMQVADMAKWSIEKQNLVGVSGTGICYSYPNQNLWIAKPNNDSVNSNKAKIKEFYEK